MKVYMNSVFAAMRKHGLNKEIEAVDEVLMQHKALLDALKATQIDLTIMRGNVFSAAKTEKRWDGMADVIDEWISRNDSVIAKTEANQ